ncbi:redox-sensitive transcriptional activator SoxR [Propionibacteriaceae bacterium Y1685]|uniref:redox-sensitive transcriptional activator SoxR n=1 Tax=Microlunatus sp. Y1700 TaxID=3418487 RepID=UPI003B7BC846
MSNAELLTMAEFSARAGVAPSALRFYEAQGLIEATRTIGNQRRFARTELRRVGFIRTAQQVGLTLEEISDALASLPRGRTPTKADWQQLSSLWRPRLDARIAHLEQLRDKLDSCIGCGCLSLKRCALANPGDEAASTGDGPVFLRREAI